MNNNLKTVQSAFESQGLDFNANYDLSSFPEKYRDAMKAFFELMVINDTANENIDPDYDNDEWKYEPIFNLSSSGSGFSYFGYVHDTSYSVVGSRLSFRSRERLLEVVKNPEYLSVYKRFMIKTK